MPWYIAALLTMDDHVLLMTMINLVSWIYMTMINHDTWSPWYIAALWTMVDHVPSKTMVQGRSWSTVIHRPYNIRLVTLIKLVLWNDHDPPWSSPPGIVGLVTMVDQIGSRFIALIQRYGNAFLTTVSYGSPLRVSVLCVSW